MMGQVKRWLEDLSVEMGYSGEITDEVMEEGLKRWPSTTDFRRPEIKQNQKTGIIKQTYDHSFVLQYNITNYSPSPGTIATFDHVKAINVAIEGDYPNWQYVYTHDEEGNEYGIDGVILREGK